jgi:hypothetical protein
MGPRSLPEPALSLRGTIKYPVFSVDIDRHPAHVRSPDVCIALWKLASDTTPRQARGSAQSRTAQRSNAPDGQITWWGDLRHVKTCRQKHSIKKNKNSYLQKLHAVLYSLHPTWLRGALRNVNNAGWAVMDAEGWFAL